VLRQSQSVKRPSWKLLSNHAIEEDSQIKEYKKFIGSFVQKNQLILGDNLVGVYLHGSAVMGCFHPKKSDLDFIIVIQHDLNAAVKRQYMDMVVAQNSHDAIIAPAKGIELSIVKESVCRPFVYPTPFVLHFSVAHLNWYQTNPSDYIKKMNGTDKDLAAHFTILYHRGMTLWGKEIPEVFAEVDATYYFDSIWNDIENAEEEITENPMYITLNLCRVLAYQKEQLILSKLEGGTWGLANLPQKYAPLIADALKDYTIDRTMKLNAALAREYAAYMLQQIRMENE
jgi:hypothetical protein